MFRTIVYSLSVETNSNPTEPNFEMSSSKSMAVLKIEFDRVVPFASNRFIFNPTIDEGNPLNFNNLLPLKNDCSSVIFWVGEIINFILTF